MVVSRILSVTSSSPKDTYDITVADNSNFFAGHGIPVLVHNCRHIITEEIIGPVQTRVVIPQLEAKVLVHVCDYVKSKSRFSGPAGFVYACKFLGKHEKRNEEILGWVGKDLAKGHSIIIPMLYRDQVTTMANEINYMYGEGTAETFMGGNGKKNKEHREGVLERAKSGQTKVVVGIRSIVQLGLNIPRWSALYVVMPISNEPNWKQESSRVLTPLEGKRQPVIRMFVDPNIGLSLGCFVNTYKQSMKFGHKPTASAIKRAGDMFELKNGTRDGANSEEYGFDIEPDEYVQKERPVRTTKVKEPKQRVTAKGLFSKK